MNVLGTKRDTSEVLDGIDEIFTPKETYTVLGRSDYVVVACRLTESTRGLVGLPKSRRIRRNGATSHGSALSIVHIGVSSSSSKAFIVVEIPRLKIIFSVMNNVNQILSYI